MKKGILTALMLVGIIGSASAQHDDLYFVPKKKKAKTEAQVVKTEQEASLVSGEVEAASPLAKDSVKTLSVTTFSAKGLPMDADTYNRRGSYLTEQGDAVSEFAMDEEGFVLITEEGDTMWMNTDTLRLTRVDEGEGWVNGFEGSDSDYEYAMRIIRFRNPRYAIPVSSPLYWDVVYGGALWPTWDWNIYDDGMYAYVFPTSSNWYYWDYMMGYPFGWNRWGHWNHWNHYWDFHYSHHWGPHWGMGSYWNGWGFYGHVWYDPWFNPHFHGYHPGWHHGHHGFYPGHGKPGWGGVTPGKPHPRENDRHATIASTRRGSQDSNTASRHATTTTTRRGASVTRTDNGSTRSSSVRVVTGRTGSSSNRSSGAVRSSSIRGGNDEVLRRGGSTSSSVSRGATTGSSSRSSYTRQSTSRSSSGSSYNRPSSTRSSSSSISRSSSSSSSRSGSYSSGSSRSSSYSGSSSYSSGSSYSSSRSSSSYSGGGSSYSGGGSRGGGSSSSGSSRSGGGGGSRR